MDTETIGTGKDKREITYVKPRTIQILDALGLPYINHAKIEPKEK